MLFSVDVCEHLLSPITTLSDLSSVTQKLLLSLPVLASVNMSSEKASPPQVHPIPNNASSSLSLGQHLKKFVTRFPLRDTRYLAAANFFVGASLFVGNGFMYVFTTKNPELVYAVEALPVTSMVGTFFYLVGCVVAVWETMNTIDGKLDGIKIAEGDLEGGNEQVNEKAGLSLSSPSASQIAGQSSGNSLSEDVQQLPKAATILLGSPEFRFRVISNDWKDLAFWAAIITLVGIVPFYISAIAYIPGVVDLTNLNIYYYLALLPYCLGGCCFTIGSVIPLILVQKKWYMPVVTSPTWWSFLLWSVGSFGFALGGSLWYAGGNQGWSATLASFWGAWCWVVGSLLRCYAVVGDY